MDRSKNIPRYLLIVGALLFISLILVLIIVRGTKEKARSVTTEVVPTPTVSNQEIKLKADLLGNGVQDQVKLSVDTIKDNEDILSFTAFDQEGNIIANLPSSLPLKIPISDSGRVYNLETKNKVQQISFNFVAGPHSSTTMFFGLFEPTNRNQMILPICKTINPTIPQDCLFWSGEGGQLLVQDFNKDGEDEVVELVDEYPIRGTLTTEELGAIKNAADTVATGSGGILTEIAQREKGGRGRKVVWAIYRHNGTFFDELRGNDYNKIFIAVKNYLTTSNPDYPQLIKKSDLSSSSLAFNRLMMKVWAGL